MEKTHVWSGARLEPGDILKLFSIGTKQIHYVAIKDVLYCCSDGPLQHVFFCKERKVCKVTIRFSLKEMLALVKAYPFLPTHKTFVVYKPRVLFHGKEHVNMGEVEVPIAEDRFEKVDAALREWKRITAEGVIRDK